MLFKIKGETDIEWKGQGSLPSFDGLNRMQGPGFICSVCHRGDSCSHQHQPKGIQNSTRGSGKRNQQNQKGEHLLCCSLSLSGPGIKRRRRRRWGGVEGLGDVEGYNENMSAGSHSSIAPKWTAFCDYTENKAKVKIEELTGVQQLYLYLTCTVCLQTQSQLSLYSINLSVKGSVNKAIQMDGVMLWEFNKEVVYIHRYVIYTCSDAVTWLTSCWGGKTLKTLYFNLSLVVFKPITSCSGKEEEMHTKWIAPFENLKCQLSNFPVFNLVTME